MRCVKCGHELAENACFCNQCGEPVLKTEVEKRQWSDKHTICVLIAVLVVVAGIGLIYKSMKSKLSSDNNDTVSAENYMEEKKEFHTESAFITESPSPEETVFSEDAIPDSSDVNVEEEVLWIREKYNEIAANIAEGKYDEYVLQDGIIAYCRDSEIHAIVLSKDVNNNPYRRFYYYFDDKLIFAYYENKDAHRFYLYEEQLMRWRYSENVTEEQDAVNHDLEYSEEYFKWENAILEESNMLKEMVYLNTAIPFRMTYIERILATSALSEYNMRHSADRLIDGDVTTAWVEGAAGQGKGEAITVYFDDEYLIHGININAGYQKSNELYNKNSRPEKIQVSFSDGTYELHTLSDINDSQDIVLNKAIVTDYISLTIESVYPGTKYEDTAISEIYIY